MENIKNRDNGLSSSTKFYEKGDRCGSGEIQYHEDPETHELIIINCWAVANGPDEVDFESEVLEVHPPIICSIMKKLVEIENKIKNI